jgi:hypothetical protein
MLAAVLCPGPSLARYQGDYELVVGVNRAATAYCVDTWCACDWQLILREWDDVKGVPLLFTNSPSARYLSRHDFKWPRRVERFEDFKDGDGVPLAPTSFSSLAAVWYAVAKGATTIRVYGADMEGTKDFDNVAAGETRTETRWQHERKLWAGMTEQLKERGIVVARAL